MTETMHREARAHGLRASRSAYLRLFALQSRREDVTEAAANSEEGTADSSPGAEGAEQRKARRSRMAIVAKLRAPMRMWPESPYPDFWVEYARNGTGWHERFLDKGPALLGEGELAGLLADPDARLCSPRRADVVDAYTRLRSELDEGEA
ncbi:hypothetical protein [Streptomyces sp. XH2]|uniref:hypothetical protein n=1 Tax=Streptomyces sp. XH2 TaxID=3412483 RepID=UPI003C7D8B7A